MRIDLQLHSTYSDGYLSPTELADFIKKNSVEVAALTDHNTVSGLREFKRECEKHKIKFIKGLELYVSLGHRKFNLLWYNFDDTHPELHEMLRASQLRRRKTARRILDNLAQDGFIVDTDRILDKHSHYVSINKVIDDFIAVKSNFDRVKKELGLDNPREDDIIHAYFHNDKIGKLKPSYISLERVVKLRQKIGGQLILCHPGKFGQVNREFWKRLQEMGIDGVEMLSPHHSYGTIMHIQKLAREFNWIETGGSDFHRFEGGNHPVQYSWRYFKIYSESLRGVKKIIDSPKIK